MAAVTAKPMPKPTRDLIEIGSVQRPHGVRGAIIVRCSKYHRAQLEPGRALVLRTTPAGVMLGMVISGVRGSADRPILELDGVCDVDTAAGLRGAVILARRDELTQPAPDEWFHVDLEECEVWCDGERIGRVRRVLALPANDVLVVDMSGDERLVPFTREAVPAVDVAARRIEVDARFLQGEDKA